jgi:hypothetical protein
MVSERKKRTNVESFFWIVGRWGDENGWHNKLVKEIVTGKKVVIFWGSQKKGVEFEQYLKENHGNVLVKFYHSKGNNTEMSADLENVRNAWKDVQVLMYTSKITVGVNFDEINIFDRKIAKQAIIP